MGKHKRKDLQGQRRSHVRNEIRHKARAEGRARWSVDAEGDTALLDGEFFEASRRWQAARQTGEAPPLAILDGEREVFRVGGDPPQDAGGVGPKEARRFPVVVVVRRQEIRVSVEVDARTERERVALIAVACYAAWLLVAMIFWH